jgi:hypothetical protein
MFLTAYTALAHRQRCPVDWLSTIATTETWIVDLIRRQSGLATRWHVDPIDALHYDAAYHNALLEFGVDRVILIHIQHLLRLGHLHHDLPCTIRSDLETLFIHVQSDP